MNDINDKISLLKKLLDEEIYDLKGKRNNEEKILQLIYQINLILLSDYDIQRQHVSTLLTVFEDRLEHVLPILAFLFLNSLEDSKSLIIKPLKTEFFEVEFDIEAVAADYFPFFKEILKGHRVAGFRISDNIDITIEEQLGLRYLSFLNKLISSQSTNFQLDLSDVNSIMLNLMIARNICNQINRKELFYFMVVVFFDALFINQKYQLARNIAEECLLCSYNDDVKELGYYISFIVFARTSNSTKALHYGLLSLKILQSKGEIYNRLIKNFYYESIKFMREINFIEYAVKLYYEKPTNVEYDDYEQNKFGHVYFSSLLLTLNKQLPGKVLEFLDRYKETIFTKGQYEAIPWISILLSIKKNYPIEEYDDNHLNQYLIVFKSMVRDEIYNDLHDRLFGDLPSLNKKLKLALVRLLETRNESDFVTDNKTALQISNINILESFINKNIEGYLLSMILQSDYSIVFRQKESKYLEPIANSFEKKLFEKEFVDPKDLIIKIKKNKGNGFLWLGADKNHLLPLFYENNNFQFIRDNHISLELIDNLIKSIIDTLPLETYSKNYYPKEVSDYENEECELLKKFTNLNLPINPNNYMLVIKDIDLSSFPHNLITNDRGFVMNKIPIANIISLEWFFQNDKVKLNNDFTRSIWIPTESNDLTILRLYSNLNIQQHGFEEQTKLIPDYPLNSDLNIIVAHGGNQINTFPAFYLNNGNADIAIKGYHRVVGPGKILVLFVCYSGSGKRDFFTNQTKSFIKEFLMNGYGAIIAPFWALHTDIPPIWMPCFMESLESGMDVGTAVFEANKKVRSLFSTPGAYACLHLYGNPFIKIA